METRGGFYITQIKQLQDRIFEKMVADYGLEISGGQGRILFVLWKQNPLTIKEISRQTSLAKNSVSIIVDGMVKKGIVNRDINPLNRREAKVTLTQEAMLMQAQFESVSQKMNELFYEGFKESEVQQFEAYLKRILWTLSETERKGLL